MEISLPLEKRQTLRRLEAKYLMLRCKINRHERFVEAAQSKNFESSVEMFKTQLSFYRKEQEQVWDEIRSFY